MSIEKIKQPLPQPATNCPFHWLAGLGETSDPPKLPASGCLGNNEQAGHEKCYFPQIMIPSRGDSLSTVRLTTYQDLTRADMSVPGLPALKVEVKIKAQNSVKKKKLFGDCSEQNRLLIYHNSFSLKIKLNYIQKD